jgi:hypothetical protein
MFHFIASLQFVKTRIVDHWLLSSFTPLNSKLNQLKLKYILGTQVFYNHFPHARSGQLWPSWNIKRLMKTLNRRKFSTRVMVYCSMVQIEQKGEIFA